MRLDYQSPKLGFTVDSRLRGNDGRFCKGLHQGRGGFGRLVCLVVTPPFTSGLRIKSAMTVLMAGMTRGVSPPCGYCLEASMTGRGFAGLGRFRRIVFTLTFDSSPIKGEGDLVGCFVLLPPRPVDTALKPV